jgi:hypothetical protein
MFGALPTAMLASKPANFCCDIEIVAVTGAVSSQRLGSTEHDESAEKTSRIETIFPRVARRNRLDAFNFDARNRYHYCRVKRE